MTISSPSREAQIQQVIAQIRAGVAVVVNGEGTWHTGSIAKWADALEAALGGREDEAPDERLKPELWWEVYDWCRDIQRIAQQVSERVDSFANAIPDRKPLPAPPQESKPQCTGPFSDAFDCPVHDPRKKGRP